MANLKIWYLVGAIGIYGCSPPVQKNASQVKSKVTSEPIVIATHSSAATHSSPTVRLNPKFQFVPKYFSFRRENDYQSKHELVAFGLKLGYRGPKPPWWPSKITRYSSVALFTNNGDKFIVPLNRLNTEFYFDVHNDQFNSDTAVVVPGLKGQMRVTKMELGLPIQRSDSTKVTISIPRNQQENLDRS